MDSNQQTRKIWFDATAQALNNRHGEMWGVIEKFRESTAQEVGRQIKTVLDLLCDLNPATEYMSKEGVLFLSPPKTSLNEQERECAIIINKLARLLDKSVGYHKEIKGERSDDNREATI